MPRHVKIQNFDKFVHCSKVCRYSKPAAVTLKRPSPLRYME
jgi:hypothetical protein